MMKRARLLLKIASFRSCMSISMTRLESQDALCWIPAGASDAFLKGSHYVPGLPSWGVGESSMALNVMHGMRMTNLSCGGGVKGSGVA